MIICFDLDGVLCETEAMEYHKARPKPEAILKLNRLYEYGHRIVIDTARGSDTGFDWSEVTRAQLADWGVQYHRLRCGVKIAADLYVDDRAVHVDTWLKHLNGH